MASKIKSPCSKCIVNPSCRRGCDEMKKYISAKVAEFKPEDVPISSSKWLQIMSNIIRKYPDSRNQQLVLAFGVRRHKHCVLTVRRHDNIKVRKIKGKDSYSDNNGN